MNDLVFDGSRTVFAAYHLEHDCWLCMDKQDNYHQDVKSFSIVGLEHDKDRLIIEAQYLLSRPNQTIKESVAIVELKIKTPMSDLHTKLEVGDIIPVEFILDVNFKRPLLVLQPTGLTTYG